MYISKFSFLVCPLNILSWQAGESRAAQGSALVIRDQKPREHPYRTLEYITAQYSTVQCMIMTLQSLTVRALLSLAAELRGRDLDPVLLRRLLLGLGISR